MLGMRLTLIMAEGSLLHIGVQSILSLRRLPPFEASFELLDNAPKERVMRTPPGEANRNPLWLAL